MSKNWYTQLKILKEQYVEQTNEDVSRQLYAKLGKFLKNADKDVTIALKNALEEYSSNQQSINQEDKKQQEDKNTKKYKFISKITGNVYVEIKDNKLIIDDVEYFGNLKKQIYINDIDLVLKKIIDIQQAPIIYEEYYNEKNIEKTMPNSILNKLKRFISYLKKYKLPKVINLINCKTYINDINNNKNIKYTKCRDLNDLLKLFYIGNELEYEDNQYGFGFNFATIKSAKIKDYIEDYNDDEMYILYYFGDSYIGMNGDGQG